MPPWGQATSFDSVRCAFPPEAWAPPMRWPRMGQAASVSPRATWETPRNNRYPQGSYRQTTATTLTELDPDGTKWFRNLGQRDSIRRSKIAKPKRQRRHVNQTTLPILRSQGVLGTGPEEQLGPASRFIKSDSDRRLEATREGPISWARFAARSWHVPTALPARSCASS